MIASPLVDSHAHLADPKFAEDLDAVIDRARQAGVVAIVAVAIDVDSSRRSVELADRYPEVWATVGIHPHEAVEATDEALNTVRALAAHPKVVAIGETGLDYYRQIASPEAQRRALEAQMALATEMNLPIVVHNRDADEDLLALAGTWAREQRAPTGGGQSTLVRARPAGVFHCFTGSAAYLRRVVEAGFGVSFAGPVTFRKAEPLLDAVRNAPAEAFLLETDSPYLAPVPFRGRRNEPGHVVRVAEAVAGARGEAIESVASATTANAVRLFGITA